MADYQPEPIVGDAFGAALLDAQAGDEVMTVAEREHAGLMAICNLWERAE